MRIKETYLVNFKISTAGLKLEKRLEEAAPTGQQLQEVLHCDDMGSENVNKNKQKSVINASE